MHCYPFSACTSTSHPAVTYLPCTVMFKPTLTIHVHKKRMTQGKAEHSENLYCLALLSCYTPSALLVGPVRSGPGFREGLLWLHNSFGNLLKDLQFCPQGLCKEQQILHTRFLIVYCKFLLWTLNIHIKPSAEIKLHIPITPYHTKQLQSIYTFTVNFIQTHNAIYYSTSDTGILGIGNSDYVFLKVILITARIPY